MANRTREARTRALVQVLNRRIRVVERQDELHGDRGESSLLRVCAELFDEWIAAVGLIMSAITAAQEELRQTRENAAGWHRAIETICTMAGVSPALSADESAAALQAWLTAQQAEIAKARAARQLVNAQAEDEGLWFVAQTAPEAYLQAALRTLHAVIEGSHD